MMWEKFLQRRWVWACFAALCVASLQQARTILVQQQHARTWTATTATPSAMKTPNPPQLFVEQESPIVQQLQTGLVESTIPSPVEEQSTQTLAKLVPHVTQTAKSSSIVREPKVNNASLENEKPLPVAVIANSKIAKSTSEQPGPISIEPEIKTLPDIEPEAKVATPVSHPASIRIFEATPEQLQAINNMVSPQLKKAYSLGDRQAIYSAKHEFFQVLRVIAQAVDTQEGLTATDADSRTYALNAAIQALREADDFSSEQTNHSVDLVRVIEAHATPVCKKQIPPTATAALQIYYDYARQQLINAAAQNRLASQALTGLGKCCVAEEQTSNSRHAQAKAMVFHQAALATDATNHLAANELGVLYGKFALWGEAKRSFLRSLNIQNDATTWQNLALVHERLGERDLAQLAVQESKQLRGGKSPNIYSGIDGSPSVQWVDSLAFNLTNTEQNMPPTMPTQTSPQRPAAQTATKTNTQSWWKPWQ